MAAKAMTQRRAFRSVTRLARVDCRWWGSGTLVGAGSRLRKIEAASVWFAGVVAMGSARSGRMLSWEMARLSTTVGSVRSRASR